MIVSSLKDLQAKRMFYYKLNAMMGGDVFTWMKLLSQIFLHVSYNNLPEISPVSKMRKLINLYTGLNKINDISGIKNLESLDYLDGVDNQIKDIS
jgi:Leucine-rich repeat (LRR) protein